MLRGDMVYNAMLLLLKIPHKERVEILKKFCLVCGHLYINCDCSSTTVKEEKNVK